MSLIDQFCRDFAEARAEQTFGVPAHRPWPVGRETCPRIPPTAEEYERAHREADGDETEGDRFDGLG